MVDGKTKTVTTTYVATRRPRKDPFEAMTVLAEVAKEVNKDGGADIEQPFYYLAGPMSGYEEFNFPAFMEAATTMREDGYNIVNPGQLDIEEHRAMHAKHDPVDVAPGTEEWKDCLRRDLGYVLHPNCLGVIAIDGWEASRGARLETYTAYGMVLKLLKFSGGDEDYFLDDLFRKDDLE